MSDDLHILAGAYAVDAVSDIERAAFDRHLAACDSCASDVADFRAVAARLGDAEQDPPPSLRADVLAAVARTRQQTAPPAPKRLAAAEGWRRVAIATAAAALIAVAATYVVMDQQVREQQTQVQALQADRERIYAVMNARDVQMRGADVAGGGRIAAAISPSEHAGVAMYAGLPTLPAGQTYQMWIIAGGVPTSAVVLPAGVSGGTSLFPLVSGADTFAITREPASGSPAPTSDPLATVSLS